jgi:hypothetical protein
MVKGIGGFGWLDSRHCEKTNYIAFGGLLATIAFFLVFFFKNSLPTINLPFFGAQPYLFVALAFFIGGYIGVIYYKVSNKKPLTLRTVTFFWDAEA